MADPANSIFDLAVWLRCKLCGGSFSKLYEFIQHKQEWHLADFQRTNAHCIVFEEVIPTDNQQFNDDFAILEETRSPTTTVSSQELCQSTKQGQVRQELKGDSSTSVPVTNENDGTSSEDTSETAPLPVVITFENSVEHEVDKTDAISVPSVYYHNDSRGRQNNIGHGTSTGIGTDDEVQPVLYYIDGQLVMEIPSELPNSEQQSPHNSYNTELTLTTATTTGIEDVSDVNQDTIGVNLLYSRYDSASALNSIKPQSISTADSGAETKKAECSTNLGLYSSISFESFTNGSPQVEIKRLTLQRIKTVIRSECNNSKTTRFSRRRRQKAPCCSCMLKKNSCFNGDHNLRNHHHSSLPTDLKPYKCPEPGCTKEFKTRGYYKRHVATHTSTSYCVTDRQRRQVFACKICKTGFERKFSLKRHNLAFHQGDGPDKPFKCIIKNCVASFNWKRSLSMHEKRHRY